MKDVLKKANLKIRKNRPKDDNNKLYALFSKDGFVQIGFQSIGCRLNQDGSCTMCNYGAGRNLSLNEIINAFDDIFSRIKLPIRAVLLGTLGSIFDSVEMPREALYCILEKLSKINCQNVIFETHYTTVDDEVIDMVTKLLPGKVIEFEFGLESANQTILSKCLNKKLDLSQINRIIQMTHKKRIEVTLNVFLGAPFLLPNEQLQDVLDSIYWAFNHNADFVVIFPANIMPFTLLEYLYKNNKYQVLSIWLLVELLDKLAPQYFDRISLAWFGNRDIIYGDKNRSIPPQGCENCHNIVMDFYEEFVSNRNIEKRKSLINKIMFIDLKCDCREKMKDSLQETTEVSLMDRIAQYHEFINLNLLKED
jgi:radical SAM enzyme (TIGR01210 family)